MTGIVDFENLVAGDPAFDLATLDVRNAPTDADRHAIQRGYGDHYFDKRVFLTRRLLYKIDVVLVILHWDVRPVGDVAGVTTLCSKRRELERALDALQ